MTKERVGKTILLKFYAILFESFNFCNLFVEILTTLKLFEVQFLLFLIFFILISSLKSEFGTGPS